MPRPAQACAGLAQSQHTVTVLQTVTGDEGLGRCNELAAGSPVKHHPYPASPVLFETRQFEEHPTWLCHHCAGIPTMIAYQNIHKLHNKQKQMHGVSPSV